MSSDIKTSGGEGEYKKKIAAFFELGNWGWYHISNQKKKEGIFIKSGIGLTQAKLRKEILKPVAHRHERWPSKWARDNAGSISYSTAEQYKDVGIKRPVGSNRNTVYMTFPR